MTPIRIPELRTPRLTLRAFRPGDLPAYARLLADRAIAAFDGVGQPRDEAESWEAMARALGQWALRGYGLFAVEHAGALIGHAGMLDPAPAAPHPELACAIAPAAREQGIATEAADAVRAWAGAALGMAALGSRSAPEQGAPTVVEVPTIETSRLRLRRFVADDYAAICAIHADPEAMRYLGDGRTRDGARTWAQLCMWTGAHALRRGGWFAVTRRSDGMVLGRCGINAQPAWPEPELAYALARAHWGQGFAAEAAGAVRDWAWRTQQPSTLVSMVKIGNAASARVAAKLGATLTGTLVFEGKPTERWEHPRLASRESC